MGKRKLKLAFFTLSEYDKEQAWLRRQHQSGWKLCNAVIPCFYLFQKCTPEDAIYQLDFNREGSTHKKEYTQMFADCGWEYVTEMAGYSYFRKPVTQMENKNEEIFCDNDSRMDMVYRILRGRVIAITALICAIAAQLTMLRRRGGAFCRIAFVLLSAALLFYLNVLAKFGVHYWKTKKDAKQI